MAKLKANKSFWITGATSGIGAQLARDLLKSGHQVIASGRSIAALEQLAAEYPTQVMLLPFDASDPTAWPDVKEKLNDLVDELDVLVIGAGICEYVDNPAESVDLYRRVFEVNYFAAVETLRIAIPLLKRSPRGRVVGIGSLAAQVAFTRAQAYGASKAAFEYWLDCQRLDLKAMGIAVTVVSPGFVDTPMTRKNDFSMPGLMTVEESSQCIVRGINAGKMYVRFPKRLFWPLRTAQWLPRLWFGPLAEKMQRNQTL